jgi:hypothetical protein
MGLHGPHNLRPHGSDPLKPQSKPAFTTVNKRNGLDNTSTCMLAHRLPIMK